jgi:[ribosomal protein S5]-alanine N-acetyltransferase
LVIQTSRLNIRDLSLSDIDNVHILHSLPETDRFNTLGIPKTIETTERLIDEWLSVQNTYPRKSYIYCIDLKDSDKFIGLIALNLRESKFQSVEIWFKVNSTYWGMGYGTEALVKMLDFGFRDLSLHRIEAGCAKENLASVKLLEKSGMTREGLKRRNLFIRGEWVDAYSYAILKEEFLAKPRNAQG